MINVKYDPSRPKESGQYYIEMITFKPDITMEITGRFGYWCDLSHVEAGILPSLIRAFPEQTKAVMKNLGIE